MTITINRINQFLRPAQLHAKQNTKLSYAIKKVLSSIKTEVLTKHTEDLEDIRIDLCSTDERGNVLHDEKGNLFFTKENLRELNRRTRELAEKEYPFTPCFISDLPVLSEEEREAFEGIVIKPMLNHVPIEEAFLTGKEN